MRPDLSDTRIGMGTGGNGKGKMPERLWMAFGLPDVLVTYAPKPDITTYELAQVTQVLVLASVVAHSPESMHALRRSLRELPPECQRHFIVTEKSRIIKPNG